MEWYQAAIVFCVAFAVTYLMVPVSKKIAVRIGAIDYPGYRRVNRGPVPRCGGDRAVRRSDSCLFHHVPRRAVFRLGSA